MAYSDLYAMGREHRGVFAVRWSPLVGLTRAAVIAKARREAWRNPYRDVMLVPAQSGTIVPT